MWYSPAGRWRDAPPARRTRRPTRRRGTHRCRRRTSPVSLETTNEEPLAEPGKAAKHCKSRQKKYLRFGLSRLSQTHFQFGRHALPRLAGQAGPAGPRHSGPWGQRTSAMRGRLQTDKWGGGGGGQCLAVDARACASEEGLPCGLWAKSDTRTALQSVRPLGPALGPASHRRRAWPTIASIVRAASSASK